MGLSRSGFVPVNLDELRRCRPDLRLSIAQASVLLGIATRTGFDWVDRGEMPGLERYSGQNVTTAGALLEHLDSVTADT